MKTGFLAELKYEARKMIKRFIDATPNNFVEEAIFMAIREIGGRLADMAQRLLDRIRGYEVAA